MIHDDFRMHRARVFLFLLLLLLLLVIVFTIRVLRDRGSDREQRKCARD